MIVRLWEFLQKTGIVIATAAVGGVVGLCVPLLLFDRDVGGAMLASILGTLGLVLGAVAGILIVRRNFD